MNGVYTAPRYVFYGSDALKESIPVITSLGKKALIVTGKSMIRQGYMKELTDMLTEKGVESVVFDRIPGEPTDTMIDEGLALYKSEGCDFLIGFGGGSPLDSAKAIGVLVTNGGNIADYNGKIIEKELPPVVAIPTTAGTGSEATQFTIISDTKTDIKMLLKGKVVLPLVAVIEPRFTMQTPKSVTSASGLDALTHAVEAYTSKKANDFTDMYAIDAVKRIFEYLPVAYNDGENYEAREQMAIAAYEAGLCINNASVTIVHGMSRPIGALFHVPHGLSNAMLLTECLSFASKGAPARFANLAKAVGKASENDTDEVAAKKLIEAMKALCEVCEVPTLEEYGVDRNAFMAAVNKMTKDALDSGSPANTLRDVSFDDVVRIYHKLWE